MLAVQRLATCLLFGGFGEGLRKRVLARGVAGAGQDSLASVSADAAVLKNEYTEVASTLPKTCGILEVVDGRLQSSTELPNKWKWGSCAKGAAEGRWPECSPATFHSCENKISAWSGNHLVWEPQGTPSGSLVVFLPGTGGSPSGYTRLQRSASKAGHHVIGLTYQSQPVATQMSNDWCDPHPPGGNSSASDCNIEFHQAMCFGQVTVNATYRGGSNDLWPVKQEHSIEAILTGVLSNLAWGGRYLRRRQVRWSKIIVSGHSQGASHAAYLSSARGTRAVLFSGPQDSWDSAKEWTSWSVPAGVVRRSLYHAYEECAEEAGGGTWGIKPGSYCPPNTLPRLLERMGFGQISEWTGASLPGSLQNVISRVEPADRCKPYIPPGTAGRIYHGLTASDFNGCTHESTEIIWEALFTGL